MKKLLTILILLISIKASAQTANAGADVLVYLSQGNSALIGGASSATSYSWTKITDSVPRNNTGIVNPSTIVSSSSQKTLLRGLTQGAWPYQIAATTGGTTVYDTVVVRVVYGVAPKNSTALDSISSSSDFASLKNASTVGGNTVLGINDRSDTVTYYGTGGGSPQFWRANWNNSTLYKWVNDETMLFVPKTNSTLFGLSHDGTNAGEGYERTQIGGSSSGWAEGNMDSSHIYCMEQQLYITVNPSTWIANNSHDVLFAYDMHGYSTNNPFGLMFRYPNIIGVEDHFSGSSIYPNFSTSILTSDSLTNKAHTFRLYEKLGNAGFYKLTYDGVTIYERTTGPVGDPYYANFQNNWVQFGGLYDFGTELVDYANTTRKRALSEATTMWRFWSMSDTSEFTKNGHPSIAVSDQSITSSSTSISASASAGSGGTLSSYSWTVLNGSATIASPTSSTTTLTGVTNGTVIRAATTQSDGQVAYSDAIITVNPAIYQTIYYKGRLMIR